MWRVPWLGTFICLLCPFSHAVVLKALDKKSARGATKKIKLCHRKAARPSLTFAIYPSGICPSHHLTAANITRCHGFVRRSSGRHGASPPTHLCFYLLAETSHLP